MDKKYLIVAVLLIIIIGLIIGIFLMTMSNVTAYENFTCNDTGTTFEVPVGLKVRQDDTSFGIRYSVMSTPDGDIVIQRSLGDNPYMAKGMSGASDLLNSYDGDKVNGVEIHTCSKTVKNEATGEVIMVTSNRGDNETVDHIINSIKWGNRTVAITANTTIDSNTNNNNANDNTDNNDAMYTEEDLNLAEQSGYSEGYYDGYSDYSDDYYYYDDSDSSWSGSSSSSYSSESGDSDEGEISLE